MTLISANEGCDRKRANTREAQRTALHLRALVRHELSCPIPHCAFRTDLLPLELPAHQVLQCRPGVLALVDDAVDLFDDGHLNTMLPGKLPRGFGGLDALGNGLEGLHDVL